MGYMSELDYLIKNEDPNDPWPFTPAPRPQPPQRVVAVAPWGDTYTAEDIENGYMPSEAYLIGMDADQQEDES